MKVWKVHTARSDELLPPHINQPKTLHKEIPYYICLVDSETNARTSSWRRSIFSGEGRDAVATKVRKQPIRGKHKNVPIE